MEDIRLCCDVHGKVCPMVYNKKEAGNMPIFAGLDWGTSEDGASYTVLTIGAYTKKGVMRVFFAKQFDKKISSDPDKLIKEIARYLYAFKVDMIAADWGFGHWMNKLLRKAVDPSKLAEVYFSAGLKQKAKWDMKTQKFIINRTDWYEEVLIGIKRRLYHFPAWEEWEKPFAEDICNIHQTTNKQGRMYYDRNPSKSDDTLSSLVFLTFAAKAFHKDSYITIPDS